MGSLLLAEILLLQVICDGQQLLESGGFFAVVVVYARWILPTTATALTTWILLDQVKAKSKFGAVWNLESNRSNRIPIAWHFACLSVFGPLSYKLVNADRISPAACMLWIAFAAATFWAWLAATVPIGKICSTLFANRTQALVSLGCGCLPVLAFELATDRCRTLADISLRLVAFELRILGESCTVAEATIHLENFWVHIAPECGGIEGILVVSFLSILYLIRHRTSLRWPHAFALLGFAATFSFLGNSVRLTALTLIGNYVSPELALGAFHSQAGWLFAAISLGATWRVSQTSFFQSNLGQQRRPKLGRAPRDQLLPFIAVLLASLIGSTFDCSDRTTSALQVALFAAAVLPLFQRLVETLDRCSFVFGVIAGVVSVTLWFASYTSNELGTNSDGTLEFPSILVYLLVAPVAEELAFRSFLIPRLSSLFGFVIRRSNLRGNHRMAKILAVAASSLLFGAMHGDTAVPATLVGFALGLLFMLRWNSTDCIIAHAICNGTIAAHALVTGNTAYLG